jgi:hypothetical protein
MIVRKRRVEQHRLGKRKVAAEEAPALRPDGGQRERRHERRIALGGRVEAAFEQFGQIEHDGRVTSRRDASVASVGCR